MTATALPTLPQSGVRPTGSVPAAAPRNALERNGLGWRWHVPGIQVTFGADYLRRHGDELHGEIMVETTLPAVRPLLIQESINFSSGATRDRIARALSAKTPEAMKAEIKWADLVQNFCVGVIRKERQGEPVVYVGRDQGKGATPDMIQHLLPSGKPTLWYGPQGSGKGWMSTAAAVCHEAGVPLADLPVKPGRSLYLDWEDSAETLNLRVQAIACGLNIPPPHIAYRPCRRPLVRDFHEIMRWVQETAADLIIIDSFGPAAGAAGDRSYEDLALGFYEAVRQLEPRTILVIDHVNGESTKDSKVAGKAFGSIYKMAAVRAAFEIRAEQQPGTPETLLGFYHTKHNHSLKYRPHGFRLEFGPADPGDPPVFVKVHRHDLADTAELNKNATIPDRISVELRHGARSFAQLYEALPDIGEPQIRLAVNRNLNKRFIRLPDGTVALAYAGTPS